MAWKKSRLLSYFLPLSLLLSHVPPLSLSPSLSLSLSPSLSLPLSLPLSLSFSLTNAGKIVLLREARERRRSAENLLKPKEKIGG